MPIRTWVRRMVRQVFGWSLIDLISGACVLITAPVCLSRCTAVFRMSGSSSRGCATSRLAFMVLTTLTR